MATLQLDLPVLLPGIPDAGDGCVDRLESLLVDKTGIERAHVAPPNGGPARLCLHYDPDVLTLAQVERYAHTAGVEITNRYGHAVFPIRAIAGEDADRRIEANLLALPGVLAAAVSLPAQRARVEFDRDVSSREAIAAALTRWGYGAEPVAPASARGVPSGAAAPQESWYARNKELAWSLTAGLFLLLGFVGERWLGIAPQAALALFLAAYAFGAWDLLRHALENVRERRFSFDIDLLMLLAATGAAVLGEWAEGAFLLFLFSLAHALEHYALDRARNAIRALAELAPPFALVRKGGREVEVPVEQVAVGDLVLVRPGDRIPVDGAVRAGQSAVNQAPVTGESVPVEKAAGDAVYAGTVNGDGALEVTATGVVGDRTLDRVIALVKEAQTQKAPTERFVERFERVYVPTVIATTVLVIVVPLLAGFWDWQTSLYRGMALLVAASPCALALGTPSAVLAGIAQAARRGVLVKGGAYLELLGTLRTLAFDKTGTLTVGQPEVTDLVAMGGVAEAELLAVAAAVERSSQHPLAEAVVRRAERDGLALPEAGELQSVGGRGVRSSLDGTPVEIGNLRLWEDTAVTVPAEISRAVAALQSAGRSVMVVRQGERWLGILGVADQPRPGVRDVLAQLRALGVRPLVMLTGDNRGVGEAIGREVGVDEVLADLLPEDKVTAVQRLQRQYGAVAMVGDGVNDAPALAHATVGVAMGGAGTAVALETADVALMADDLSRLPFAVGLSRQARQIIRQNVGVALLAIAVLIVATITGVVGIGVAVLIHEGTTLVVIANALRLLGYRGQ
jgi:Zn2+/Cd2+-exporting ATPase